MTAFAHNPLSARYHLEVDATASILTINLSQDGVNQVLINTYGMEDLKNLDQKAFKERIVAYIKEHFNVAIDNKKLKLDNGGIRLGEHQTDLKFVLDPISRDANALNISISAFEENNNHQSIFSYTIYGKKDRVILSKRNDYQAEKYLNVQKAETPWPLIVLIVGIVMTTLFIMSQKSLVKLVNFEKFQN